MSGFGNSVENALLDCALRGVPYPYSAGNSMSLHILDPADVGIFEVAGLSYTRQPCTWNAASGGVCTLVSDVVFLGLPANTIGFFGVWNSAGVFIGAGIIPTQIVGNGDAITVNAGTTFSLE